MLPPKSCVGILTPECHGIGGGLLRGDGHEGGALVASISALIKTPQRDSLAPAAMRGTAR